MFFGNSRGSFTIERHEGFEGVWQRLCRKIHIDSYGFREDKSPLKENDYGGVDSEHIWVMPYYWGDCVCGYDEREEAWRNDNHHKDGCYRTLVREDMISKGCKASRLGGYDMPKHWSYDKYSKVQDEVRQKWCEHFGLPYPSGCAVHCTCDYNDRWHKFLEENDHSDACPIVLPNFIDKETGFTISWYKYPFRDAYMSDLIGVGDFEDIIDRIITNTFKT